MRVTIPDQLADVYQAVATKQGLSLDDVVSRQLRRFQTLIASPRVVVLGPDHLDALELKLHGGQIPSPEDLIAKVSRLAGVSFCGIDLQLTPAQVEELAHRAERQGKSVEALVQEIWEQLAQQFFHSAGTFVGR